MTCVLYDISVFNPCIHESNMTYYLGFIFAQPHLLMNANPDTLLSILAIFSVMMGI